MAGNKRTQVVEYNPTGIDINMPESSNTKAIAYVRPEDVIILNFDINDIKVEVIEGDVQIIFNNGSTITLASLASIGFSNTAPVLQDPNGNSYSLDQFLSKAEVLNYDEAILILTNRDEVKLVNTQPKVVKQASESEADLTAGTPITGDGITDMVTKGIQSSVIDPQGKSTDTLAYSGKGAFVPNNFTTNKPFNQDNDKNKPGTSHAVKEPSVKTSIMYGSVMEKSEQITMNDTTYTPYKFKSGPFETDDPTNLLVKKDIKDTSNQNLFVVNRTDKISYGLKLNYGGGVDPTSIAIFIPKSVAAKISLDPSAGGALIGSPIVEPDGSVKYNVSGLTADKTINGIVSVAADLPDTRFELKYRMTYIDEASGLEKITDITQAVAVTAVRRGTDLNKLGDTKNIRLLSSSPSPINLETGTGNDIIITGSSGSNIKSAGGDNKIFTGAGDDTIYFGNGENNKVWGSLGYDIIKGTGNAGNNTVYYNNFKDDIDSTKVNFKDEYYNTLPSTNIPLSLYLGYDKDTLSSLMQSPADQTRKTAMQNEIEDGSLLVNKSSSSGADILTKVSRVFLSNDNNTLYVSDRYAATTSGIIYNITGYSPAPSNAPAARSSSPLYQYTINLDGENFTGASTVNIQTSIVQSSISKNEDNVILKFTNFNVFEGRANQGDTFIAGINTLFNIMTINGKSDSGNKVDYSQMDTSLLPGDIQEQGIVFQTVAKNRAIVYKGGTTSAYRDNIMNIQHIKGTVKNDTFISDYLSSYTFDGNEGDNKVDYSKVTTGIRYDVGAQKVYKTTGSDYLSSQQDTLMNINSIILTPSDDIISGDLLGSHDFNGGGGRDTLTYETINGPIVYTLVSGDQNNKYGKATIVKTGGGTDTFDLSLQNGTKYVANISEVQGSQGDDTFNLDVFENASANMEYDGKGGKNTISYLGSKLVAGASGVKFYINGDKTERSSVYRKGGIDFFKNITNLQGSKGDDTISFTDQITKFDNIKDYNVDFSSENSKNTVDFEKLNTLQDIIKDDGGKNGLKFTIVNGTVVVNFGYLKNPENAEFVGDANNKLIFKGISNIVGSNHDNLFEAVATGNYSFDGKGGKNTADYRNVNEEIEFRLDINQVKKGDQGTDFLANVTTILGSSEKKNTFYLDGNKNYKVIGNDRADIQNVLDYQYSSKGMTFDFLNGKIYKGDKTADEIAANSSSDYDSYDRIQQIIGSSYNDRYLAFESAEAKSVELHGGSGTNTLDFSRIVSSEYKDLNLNLTNNPDNGQAQDITVANVTWQIKNHNGIYSINSIKGTKEGNNTYNVKHYKAGLSIDGGEKGKTSEGQNHLTYADDDSLGLDVSISDKINLNRRYDNGERYSDIAQNINKLTLSKNANDTVRLYKDIIKSELNIIDANGYKKISGSENPEDVFANSIKFDDFETTADKFMTVNINAGLQVGVAYSLSEGSFDKQLLNFHSFDLGKNHSLVNFTQEAFTTESLFGLKFEGGEISYTKVTFKNAGAVTLDLNQSAGEKGSVILNSTNKKIDTSFYNIKTYEVASDSYIYAIYNKSSEFKGGDDSANNNTLDYSKVGAEKQGILINLNEARVYKGTTDNPGTDYDSYDKSFRNIKGSQGSDTVRITDLTALSGSQSLNVNLGYNTPASGAFDNANGSNNTLKIDVNYKIYYNLTGGTLSASENGSNSVDVSTIKGTSNLRLADNKQNVLLVKGSVDASQIPYKLINGGNYNPNDRSTMNLIDASSSDKYFMFDASTGKLSTNGGDNQWSSYKVVNFNYIKGSSVGSSFLSYGIESYVFVGHENADNTLSYQKSTVGVTVNIIGNGSGVVNKSGDNKDTYENIKNFVGSNVHDDYKVSNSDITFLDGITIQGNFNTSSDMNNAIIFDASIENLTLDLTTENAQWDKVSVSDGGMHSASSFKTKNLSIYNFTNKVKHINIVIQDALQQNVYVSADSSILKMIYKNTTDNITFYAEDSKVIRGSYSDSLKGISILEYAGSKKIDINAAYNRNHTYLSSSTGEMHISYASANTNFDGLNVDFNTDVNGYYTINKGSTYKDLIKNANSITGITGKQNIYSIIDHSNNQTWKVVTINGGALDVVSFEKFYGNPATDTARHDFTSNQLSNFSTYGYNLINISNYKLTGKGTFKFQANDTSKGYIIDGGLRNGQSDNTFDYTELENSPTTTYIFGSPGQVTVNKQFDSAGSKITKTDLLSHVTKIIGVKNGSDIYQIGSSIQFAGIQEHDKSGTQYTNSIDFGKVTITNKLIFRYNDGNINVTEEGPNNTTYNQTYQYFSDIKVSKTSEVHVASLSEAKPVKFSAPSGSTAIFYVGDTPGVADVYVNYVKTGITSLRFNQNSSSTKVAELLSFGGVKTEGSSTAIHISKKVTETGMFEGHENQYTNSITYEPGGSGDLVFLNTSQATYHSAAMGNGSNDEFKNIYIYNLNNASGNTVTIAARTPGAHKILVDGGTGGNNSVILGAGYKNVTLDFSSSGLDGVISGYDLKNFQSYTLSTGDDTVYIDDVTTEIKNRYILDGGGSENKNDRIFYTKVSKDINITFDLPPAGKLYDTFAVDKTEGLTDIISRFDKIHLNKNVNNTFNFRNYSHSGEYLIDFGEGSTKGTANFSSSLISGTFIFDEKGALQANFSKTENSQVVFNFTYLTNFIATTFDDKFNLDSEKNYGNLNIRGNVGTNTIIMSGSKDTTFYLQNGIIQTTAGKLLSFSEVQKFIGSSSSVNTFVMSDKDTNNNIVNYNVNGGGVLKNNTADFSNISISNMNFEVKQKQIDATTSSNKNTLQNISTIKLSLTATNVVKIIEKGNYYNNELNLEGGNNADNTIDFTGYTDYSGGIIDLNYNSRTVATLTGINYILTNFTTVKMVAGSVITVNIDTVNFNKIQNFIATASLSAPNASTDFNLKNSSGNLQRVAINLSSNLIEYSSSQIKLNGVFNINVDPIKVVTVKIIDPSQVRSNVILSKPTDGVTNTLDLTGLIISNGNSSYLLNIEYSYYNNSMTMKLEGANGKQITNVTDLIASNASATMVFTRNNPVVEGVTSTDTIRTITAGAAANQTLRIDSSLSSPDGEGGAIVIDDTGIILGQDKSNYFNAEKITAGYMRFKNFKSIIAENNTNENVHVKLNSANIGKLTHITLATASNISVIHQMNLSSMKSAVSLLMDQSSIAYLNVTGGTVSADAQNTIKLTGFNYIYLSKGHNHTITVKDIQTNIHLYSDTQSSADVKTSYIVNDTISNVYLSKKTVLEHEEIGFYLTKNGAANPETSTSGIMLPNALSLSSPNEVETVNFIIGKSPFTSSGNTTDTEHTVTFKDLNNTTQTITNVKNINLFGWWSNLKGTLELGKAASFIIEKNEATNATFRNTVNMTFNPGVTGTLINLAAPYLVQHAVSEYPALARDYNILTVKGYIANGIDINTSITIKQGQASHKPVILMPLVMTAGDDARVTPQRAHGRSEVVVTYPKKNTSVELIYTKGDQIEGTHLSSAGGMIGANIKNTSDSSNVTVYNANYIILENGGFLKFNQSFIDLIKSRLTSEIDTSKVWGWNTLGEAHAYAGTGANDDNLSLAGMHIIDRSGTAVFNYPVISAYSSNSHIDGNYYIVKDSSGGQQAKVEVYNFLYFKADTNLNARSIGVSYDVGTEHIMRGGAIDKQPLYMDEAKEVVIHDVRDGAIVNCKEDASVSFANQGLTAHWAVGSKDIAVKIGAEEYTLKKGDYLIVQNEDKTRTMYINHAKETNLENNPTEQRDDSLNENGNWNVHDGSSMHHELPATPHVTEEDVSGSSGYDPNDPHSRSH